MTIRHTPTAALLRFSGAAPVDHAVTAWFSARPGPLGALAREWFTVIRNCGADVHELLHDGCPTACISDAGFAYVNVFTAHVNVGFFQGASLDDPAGLLQGSGKWMRHVKLRPDALPDAVALRELVQHAYADMQARLRVERRTGA